MYGSKTLEEVTLNLRAGPLQLAATSLILVSPFTKFALTLEPVARGTEQFLQQVSLTRVHEICTLVCCNLHLACLWTYDAKGVLISLVPCHLIFGPGWSNTESLLTTALQLLIAEKLQVRQNSPTSSM